MNNIKVFENDLPDIDLSVEKRISLDCEALGSVSYTHLTLPTKRIV